MQILISNDNNVAIAEILSEKIILANEQDALDVIANCGYNGSSKIIIYKENISPDFFDLKTKIAGDILQKFSNYKSQLAIVGDFNNITSKSLNNFIFESNKTGLVVFVDNKQDAIKHLAK